MVERLTIKNFGPIKNMQLDLRMVNILIGDQGSGKSTVAKILMVVKEMLSFVESNWKHKPPGLDLLHFQDQLAFHDLTNFITRDSFIELIDSSGSFRYEMNDVSLKSNSEKKDEKGTYIGTFIPSYREAAILLKNSINALAALKVPVTNWFFLFGQQLMNSKLAKTIYDYSHILGVKYKYVNEKDVIVLNNGKEINMEEASSAIHSAIPLLLVFDSAVNSMHPTTHKIVHRRNRPFIVIEEPELNCFPSTQKKIMEHLIQGIKFEHKTGTDYWCGLIISTHSPYILTSLNNMLYAHTVGQKDYAGTNAILNEEFWLNPDDVSAYMLYTDGRCEDIFNREEGLIDAGKIDGVTNTLNEEFNALLNLELLPK